MEEENISLIAFLSVRLIIKVLWSDCRYPKLEAALHNAFADRKLNFVNQRREFFNVSLDEIKQVIKDNYDKSVEFVELAPAEQYRESLKLKEQAKHQVN